jgi:transketolase
LSSFAVFLTHRALDPIRLLVAQPHSNVKIGAAYAGLLTGLTGKTHQDVQDIAIMRAMPGMTVLAPGDAVECAAMVRWATGFVGPVYLRLTRDPSPVLFTDTYEFEPGAVHVLRGGEDVLLLSTGPQTARCLEAAELLEVEAVSVGVLHVPSIKPVDEMAIVEACRRSALVVTVEEHSVLGGLGGLIAEILTSHSPRRVIRLGLEDCWGESAPNAFLLDKHGLSAGGIADRVLRELSAGEPHESGRTDTDERVMS